MFHRGYVDIGALQCIANSIRDLKHVVLAAVRQLGNDSISFSSLAVFPLKNGVSMRIPQSETDYHHTYHDTCAIFCWIYDGHFYEAILKHFEAS